MSYSGNNYFLDGSWNVICDRCGEKFKATGLLKEWTGLMVCRGCWEPRHPLDFIRATPDKMSVPFVRPQQPNKFIGPDYGDTQSSVLNEGTINGFILNG